MKAARIENGLVADLWDVPTLTAYEGITLVEAGDEVGMSWLFNGSVFSKPTPTLEDTDNLKASVRSSRNALLSATDWTQVADATVDQAVWATYRQALRDVPAQSGFPSEITWPDKPA